MSEAGSRAGRCCGGGVFVCTSVSRSSARVVSVADPAPTRNSIFWMVGCNEIRQNARVESDE